MWVERLHVLPISSFNLPKPVEAGQPNVAQPGVALLTGLHKCTDACLRLSEQQSAWTTLLSRRPTLLLIPHAEIQLRSRRLGVSPLKTPQIPLYLSIVSLSPQNLGLLY